MLPFPPLYLQLNPLGHKVTFPAKDNNQHEVIILDSVRTLKSPPNENQLSHHPLMQYRGKGRIISYSPTFPFAVPAASTQASPRDATFSQMHTSSCLPDGSRLLNKLPDFFSPLGISFQCYLVTSGFLHLDDVEEHAM